MNESLITKEAVQFALGINAAGHSSQSSATFDFSLMEETLPLRHIERLVRHKYVEYIRANSTSDSDAAKKLGLAPSNYHRMCKELGIK
jgi:transcriptional regulator with GAF, ATPase, and Fis domain